MNFIIDLVIKKIGVVKLLTVVWARAKPELEKYVEKTPAEWDNVALDVIDDAMCKFGGICVSDEK